VSRSHQESIYRSEKVGIRNSPARCRLRSETIDYVIRGRVAREMSRLSQLAREMSAQCRRHKGECVVVPPTSDSDARRQAGRANDCLAALR
jgi:hypothetical protein